ncbi:TAT-variant-translocated molybdopterin oxidoreductase [Marinivivus vitaminiproducens]|uniref:TAT-variant-translocated molybdopterin oxidoreductase n=1 Tax=Marinivivus vitaminiproducens TaxID=3035935 RepID=UPI0027A49991|nr:TAT-variant-translocated molybdopterin oxidoreductase [Geminicoccaceae bacterium SCSIO 64248]
MSSRRPSHPPEAGRQWRSVEEFARSPAFEARIRDEFPAAMPQLEGPSRRTFLTLMAASFAMTGLTGCEQQTAEAIVPRVRDPGYLPPDGILHYATAHVQDGIASGILVKTVDGRPIKIEGNPEHPVTRGATDAFMQASILGLYDPDRSQSVVRLGRTSGWQTFETAVVQRFAALRASQGEGLRLLTGPIGSPTTIGLMEGLLRELPRARWHVHAPLADGRAQRTHGAFERAKLVVAFDGDFLDPGPDQAATSRAWADARRTAEQAGFLAELHVASSTPGLTSAKADHGVVVEPSRMPLLAEALLDRVEDRPPRALDDATRAWIDRAFRALRRHAGEAIVTAGRGQPARLHGIVARLNRRLGNTGRTVWTTASPIARAGDPASSLDALAEAIAAGEVGTLVMLDVNPVYTAPRSFDFGTLIDRVDFTLHIGSHVDETGVHCQWHAPLAHPLESWGDARAADGTASIVQPTIRPLYGARSLPEYLVLLRDGRTTDGRTLVEAYWRAQWGKGDFDERWRRALTAGFIADSAFAAEEREVPEPISPGRSSEDGLTVLFRPDPTIWDGSYANNPWLQELPKPLAKIVWDNIAVLGPALAAEHGIASGDRVEIGLEGRKVEAPAWVLPGQAPRTVTLYLGQGRWEAGSVGNGVGYDAYTLRPAGAAWQAFGATLLRLEGRAPLATTQESHGMDGHDFVRVHTLASSDATTSEPATGHPSLYPEQVYDDQPREKRAWAMAIDLDSCIGCNACAVACQAENNIPVVGREQVAIGRDMHWLRIDRYYEGPPEAPRTHFQPVPCMHCEQAPCEVGCPVAATLHDREGLNLQIYNRCVGTRTCSSYCPYKVRRFNYFDYTSGADTVVQAQRNPDVTVRTRGVMEKCTYCVQRITAARIRSNIEERPIADGEVVTACQAACPTRAITFGDLEDDGSAVNGARSSPRHYVLLEELNTRPRTTYLAKLAPETDDEEPA